MLGPPGKSWEVDNCAPPAGRGGIGINRTWSRLAATAALALVVHACSCGDAGTGQLSPKFTLEGAVVIADPKGEAHYAIDFGTVTVGSRFAPTSSTPATPPST